MRRYRVKFAAGHNHDRMLRCVSPLIALGDQAERICVTVPPSVWEEFARRGDQDGSIRRGNPMKGNPELQTAMFGRRVIIRAIPESKDICAFGSATEVSIAAYDNGIVAQNEADLSDLEEVFE